MCVILFLVSFLFLETVLQLKLCYMFEHEVFFPSKFKNIVFILHNTVL